jgi:plastocyanin
MLMSLLLGTMTQPIFGQSSVGNSNSIVPKIVSVPQNTPSATEDTTVPNVRVVNPNWCSAVGTGKIIINGTSSDNGTGVKIVEVRVDKNKYLTTTTKSHGNWSYWSVPIDINDTAPHRILARATDYSGNQNWEDITINSPIGLGTLPPETAPVMDKKNRIAFVEPTFTNAAYSANHFYAWYGLYERSTVVGDKTTTNLDMLTASVPMEPETDISNFTEHVKEFVANATVSIIRDEDAHNGYIFRPDGSNAYDTLFLLHDEYVTEDGYNNFKRFVSNGGTIVFLDGNVFYAQVRYDPKMCTVTLVKGHDWVFDGKVVIKADHEAYFDDKKKWMGSNYLYGDMAVPISFMVNPFNYSRFEENYVNNPNVTILFDYAAEIPREILEDNPQAVGSKIATYELSYGKGKVIMMGLYTQNLNKNEKFLKFFDHIVLPRALGQPYRYDAAAGNESVAYWWMNTGKVSKIERDGQSNGLILTLERSDQIEDKLTFTLPQSLVGGGDPRMNNFAISVNDKEVNYSRTPDDVETGFEIPLTSDATKVQISMITNNTDNPVLNQSQPTPSGSTNNTDLSNKAQAELNQSQPTPSGSNESGASNNKSPKIVNIEIVDGANSAANNEFYKPAIIDINKGTTVIWTNNDVEVHTVTSGNLDTGARTGTFFDSGYLSKGDTFQHIFNDPRTYDYYCTLHPFMKGKVIVK